MINQLSITNPKRFADTQSHENWFPYYAGFSSDFVAELLKSADISDTATIMDPWNGSGTTTTTASRLGFNSRGYDLNPVMVIAAKASLVDVNEITSLKPLANDIIKRAKTDKTFSTADDPLNIWFLPSYGHGLRKIEKSIQKILIDPRDYHSMINNENVDRLSGIASFYYVALFRSIRKLVEPFKTSNPTWIKIPKQESRLRPHFETIIKIFNAEIEHMISSFNLNRMEKKGNAMIKTSSSCSLPFTSDLADLVISSPPYCTRIDYAVATMPELTILGYKHADTFDELRRKLIGSSTVPKKTGGISEAWGDTCNRFLNQILKHHSKASETYYFKNHIQYFDSIFKSVSEIKRLLKPDGYCILVVQDSYYKDIHNDLSKIFIEMADTCGLEFNRREDFLSERNMAKINPNVQKYRTKSDAIESVICLKNSN